MVKFKAEKEGYSDIHFRAAIPEKYFFEDSLKKISAEDLNRLKNQEVKTNYKAIYCPYEVLLKQRVTIKTPSNLLDSIGVVNWVELKGVNSDLALKGEGIKYMAVVYEDLIWKFSWMTGSGDVELQGLKVGPVGVYAISYGFGKEKVLYPKLFFYFTSFFN